MEELFSIEGFEGRFITKSGIIYSNKYNGGYIKEPKPMKYKEDKDGYWYVGLRRGNERKWFRVSRLVATQFIPNPENYPIVNHLDGNVKNNNVSNLEWCTNQTNIRHSYDVLGRTGYAPNKIKVIVDDKQEFNSLTECAEFLGVSLPRVSYALANNQKAKGHKVSYL